jgi:signal transduction histidine kinase/ActR/RegA family two-component response regulator
MFTINLKNRFRLVIFSMVALLISMTIITAAGIWRTHAYIQQAIDMDAMVDNLHELQILSTEYVSTPSDRVKQQWLATYERDRIRLNGLRDMPNDVKDALTGLRQVFERLTAPPSDAETDKEELQRRLRNQLVATLNLESQRIIDWVTELSTQKKDHIVPRLMFTGAAMFVVMLSVALVTILTMVATTRHITSSISSLKDGAEEIAAGRLGFQVRLTGNDEVASLASAVNRMSRDLMQSYRVLLEQKAQLETETIQRQLINDALRTKTAELEKEIREHKQAEERERELQGKLERAARMESLGVLAGGVAHDLNNVLGPIVLLPDLISDYIEQNGDPANPEHADTLEAVRTIKASAQRAAGVVSDLVVMGRRGQYQRTPVDVNRAVELVLTSKQVKDLHAQRPDVHVMKQLTSEPAWCLGSEARLARMLANLVGNAEEAISGHGDVVIHTGQLALTTPHPGYETVPAGAYVTITVTDTGCGMDAKTLARIFEPFFSTKAPSERSGSGLGLSVVHGLVRDHEGFLDVRSEQGKGTTFTVYLPAAAAGEVPETSGSPLLPGGSERILVVDDEPAQQISSQIRLKKMGYEVTAVASGEKAVELFELPGREGKPAPFDLVMTDMIMKGLDGMATCKAILELYPKQRLLIASGHAPAEYKKRLKEMGAGWLAKPYTAADLARAVRAQLDA